LTIDPQNPYELQNNKSRSKYNSIKNSGSKMNTYGNDGSDRRPASKVRSEDHVPFDRTENFNLKRQLAKRNEKLI